MLQYKIELQMYLLIQMHKWQIVAQGDSGAVLSTRGDIIRQVLLLQKDYQLGVSGTVLTTDGTDAFGQLLKVEMFYMFQWQVVIQVLVHNINLIEQLNMR